MREATFGHDLVQLASLRDLAALVAMEAGNRIDLEALAVVVSELTTNAVVHQEGEAKLTVSALDDGTIVVEVADADPTPPQIGQAGVPTVGGHGLVLVDALADAWGVDVGPHGKRVWAHLAPVTAGDQAPTRDRRSGARPG